MSGNPQAARALPRWRLIHDELDARLRAGRYADGFPGELALAEEFSVSRGTVRQALRPLRARGAVTAGRGLRPRAANLSGASSYGAIYSFHEAARDAGSSQRSRTITQEITRDPAIAARLGLAAEAELFFLHRVRLVDDAPVAVDWLWSPAAIAGPLLGVDFENTAFYRELLERTGITVAGGREFIQALAADAETAALLGCSPGTALLDIDRMACHDGTPIEVRRTLAIGDRLRLSRPFGEGLPEGTCGERG